MPEHRVSLDPRNPGQVFACCGLFELSELAQPGGEAWFEDNATVFVLRSEAPVPPQDLKLVPEANLDDKPYDATIEPLELVCGGGVLVLSWWLNNTLTGKSALKTWGGQQRPRRVLDELLRLLNPATPTSAFLAAAAYTTSRFGVDARSAWEALDVGYSPNELGQSATTFPWVEVLAIAGLQGFRPAMENRSRYRYAAWLTPLTMAAARAACAAPWPGLPSLSFRFEIASRGQGYKTFLFAKGVDHV